MIDTNGLEKSFYVIECKEIQSRAKSMPFEQYVRVELKRLIDNGNIQAKIQCYCKRHYYHFDATPLTIFSNQVIYTQCPRCDMEIERQRNGYISEEEKKIMEQEAHKRMLNALNLRGVPQVFFTQKVDYDKGFLKKYSYLLKEELKNNLIVMGAVGSGKSTFIYELCKNYYLFKKTALVVSFDVLIAKHKRNYSNIEVLREEYADIDCLCIDEMDNISAHKNFSVIDDLISYFYDTCKKIVFAGNFNIDDFKKSINEKSEFRLKGRTSIINSVYN